MKPNIKAALESLADVQAVHDVTPHLLQAWKSAASELLDVKKPRPSDPTDDRE